MVKPPAQRKIPQKPPQMEPNNQQGVDQSAKSDNFGTQKIAVSQTKEFQKWLQKLGDREAKTRIATRIVRLQEGNFGDVKMFDGIGELRIDYGPGYRLYFAKQGSLFVLLLCGGDKGSQERDIKRAVEMSKEI